MRIGVDACCWANRRGYGRFTRELLTALARRAHEHDYVYFADAGTVSASTFPPGVEVAAVRTSAPPTEAASSEGRRSVADIWAFTREVARHHLDLMFFPASYSYFPVLNRAKVVVTLHDMIAENHPSLVFPNRKLKLYWQLKQRLAVSQAHRLLTVSEYSKQQIRRRLGLPEGRIGVICEAAKPVFRRLAPNGRPPAGVRHGLEPDARYLMYVGGISPHKNLKTLVDAFAQLIRAPGQAPLRLLLVGDYANDAFHSEYRSLADYTAALGMTERVVFTGFVDDEELVELYNNAAALVLPSFEEGFGLPAIEAMACGTPVISSNRGSLPEVLGDAGHLFDPHSAQELLACLRLILDDDGLVARMRERGLSRSREFTWDRAAEQTATVFREIAPPEVAPATAEARR